MAGGDYHRGLHGCGTSVAHGLARCGFGDTLLSALETQPEESFNLFLQGWLHEVCQELRTNSHNFVGRRCIALASRFTAGFPKYDILQKYSQPITSWSQGPVTQHISRFSTLWKPLEPSIRQITTFCVNHFGWQSNHVIQRFEANLWEGVCVRMLCSVSTVFHLSRWILP